MSGGQRAFKAPRVSHSATAARVNMGRSTSGSGSHTNNPQTHASNARALTNNNQSFANNTRNPASRSAARTNLGTTGTTTGTVNPALTGALNTTPALSSGVTPSTYTYGTGNGARSYRAYGYGNGYRNRRYGGGYGYGRSQGNNRAVVARLRSVHASLARIDHDYQGHRARAMHAVSMAIRQLSHRSMVYSGVGFSSGMNNGQGRGMGGQGMGRQGMGGQGMGRAGGRGRQPMSQAQSDARMSQDLRVLQGINMQIGSQGSTSGHARAGGHVQRAIHELNVALSIR
jgi:hypothetical protein